MGRSVLWQALLLLLVLAGSSHGARRLHDAEEKEEEPLFPEGEEKQPCGSFERKIQLLRQHNAWMQRNVNAPEHEVHSRKHALQRELSRNAEDCQSEGAPVGGGNQDPEYEGNAHLPNGRGYSPPPSPEHDGSKPGKPDIDLPPQVQHISPRGWWAPHMRMKDHQRVCRDQTLPPAIARGDERPTPTDAKKCHVEDGSWEAPGAGLWATFKIQAVLKTGQAAAAGGDSWQVMVQHTGARHREDNGVQVARVWDHGNGLYEVAFVPWLPGRYEVTAKLLYSNCHGHYGPPAGQPWFSGGFAVQSGVHHEASANFVAPEFYSAEFQKGFFPVMPMRYIGEEVASLADFNFTVGAAPEIPGFPLAANETANSEVCIPPFDATDGGQLIDHGPTRYHGPHKHTMIQHDLDPRQAPSVRGHHFTPMGTWARGIFSGGCKASQGWKWREGVPRMNTGEDIIDGGADGVPMTRPEWAEDKALWEDLVEEKSGAARARGGRRRGAGSIVLAGGEVSKALFELLSAALDLPAELHGSRGVNTVGDGIRLEPGPLFSDLVHERTVWAPWLAPLAKAWSGEWGCFAPKDAKGSKGEELVAGYIDVQNFVRRHGGLTVTKGGSIPPDDDLVPYLKAPTKALLGYHYKVLRIDASSPQETYNGKAQADFLEKHLLARLREDDTVVLDLTHDHARVATLSQWASFVEAMGHAVNRHPARVVWLMGAPVYETFYRDGAPEMTTFLTDQRVQMFNRAAEEMLPEYGVALVDAHEMLAAASPTVGKLALPSIDAIKALGLELAKMVC